MSAYVNLPLFKCAYCSSPRLPKMRPTNSAALSTALWFLSPDTGHLRLRTLHWVFLKDTFLWKCGFWVKGTIKCEMVAPSYPLKWVVSVCTPVTVNGNSCLSQLLAVGKTGSPFFPSLAVDLSWPFWEALAGVYRLSLGWDLSDVFSHWGDGSGGRPHIDLFFMTVVSKGTCCPHDLVRTSPLEGGHYARSAPEGWAEYLCKLFVIRL